MINRISHTIKGVNPSFAGETDESYREEEDVKLIVREVLNELNKSKEQA